MVIQGAMSSTFMIFSGSVQEPFEVPKLFRRSAKGGSTPPELPGVHSRQHSARRCSPVGAIASRLEAIAIRLCCSQLHTTTCFVKDKQVFFNSSNLTCPSCRVISAPHNKDCFGKSRKSSTLCLSEIHVFIIASLCLTI